MKVLLVILALFSPAKTGSLGIGMDVLPEAFTFAARRVGFSADPRLTTCTASRCVWDIGGGVEIAAEWSTESLDIRRVEATFDPVPAARSLSIERYEKACLAIVALFDPKANSTELQAAAKAITSPSGKAPRAIRVQTEQRYISLYGKPALTHGDAQPSAKRCGAVAV